MRFICRRSLVLAGAGVLMLGYRLNRKRFFGLVIGNWIIGWLR